MLAPCSKTKTTKIRAARGAARSAVRGYFAEASKRSDLPNRNGSLSASVIKEANKAVKSNEFEGKSKQRGSYAKLYPEQQAAIGRYAFLHGNQPAIRHFSKQLDVIFSSARGVLANGCVLVGQPFEPVACACMRAVDHAKFKTTKIYSQGILVNYTKICTNENFPLYGATICELVNYH